MGRRCKSIFLKSFFSSICFSSGISGGEWANKVGTGNPPQNLLPTRDVPTGFHEQDLANLIADKNKKGDQTDPAGSDSRVFGLSFPRDRSSGISMVLHRGSSRILTNGLLWDTTRSPGVISCWGTGGFPQVRSTWWRSAGPTSTSTTELGQICEEL